MPGSDRAFRALAHAEPQFVVATLRALCPALLTPDELVTPDDLEPTKRLLALADTACFAPAAAPGPGGVEALCLRVAELFQAARASWYRWHMAVVCAATQGRYDAMLHAVSQVGVERIVIEDLVNFGRDRGLEQGLEQGLAPLVRLVERRVGRPLSEPEREGLRPRLARLGPERLGDVVLDLDPAALASWLADPNAT